MADYRAPVKDMMFVINVLARLDRIMGLPGYEEATPDLVEAVLEEASQLAAEVIGPVNTIGDAKATRVEDGQVFVASEFKAAYEQFRQGGWSGVSHSVEAGGQGLPYVVGLAVEEMWQAASLAWSLCPLLTEGAARAIETHGSEALKALVLEKMVTGEWTGTMNLTESQAGSDLAAIRTQAIPDGDGFRISGQKIFITYGDHDMTDNVIHLVLARTPDAAPGVKGLTLFAVPKRLINADGSVGDRNNVRAVSVEHKLGIHGSPTCVLDFDNALGYVVGEIGRGIICMFTMMNHARISVGLEGVAISERAYQQALDYAKERVQGRAPGHDGPVTIIQHADVRRMLLTMKAHIEAMRAIAYLTAAHLDAAYRQPDAEARNLAQARLELMTPIVKGWCTEIGQILTSIGLQVHGGMGYVEETGAAQHLRDARITTIYEGTTGIQAADLVGRKILHDGGVALRSLIAEMRQADDELAEHDDQLSVIRIALREGIDDLAAATDWLFENHERDADIPGAVSNSFLMLIGTLAGGWQMARAAAAAARRIAAGDADKSFYEAKIVTARFYAEQIMPVACSYRKAIESGGETIMALSEEQF
jgi:alkylation response protein AidB-like acyl-CoA dehydrogenase